MWRQKHQPSLCCLRKSVEREVCCTHFLYVSALKEILAVLFSPLPALVSSVLPGRLRSVPPAALSDSDSFSSSYLSPEVSRGEKYLFHSCPFGS